MKKILFIIPIAVILILCGVLMTVKKEKEIILQGQIEVRTADAASKITGRVLELKVQEGDKVNKGDTLMLIETPEINAKYEQGESALQIALLQAQKASAGAREEQINIAKSKMEQAQAGLEFAEKTYNRINNLFQEGVVPAQKADEAKAQYINAQKIYDSAKSAYQMYLKGERKEDRAIALANTKRAKGAVHEVNSYLDERKIKAPITGEVVGINVEEGELINAGYPVITVADLGDVWAIFDLREDLLTKIKMGTVLNAEIPALGKNIDLKVNYISPLGAYANYRATKARGDFDMKTFEIKARPIEPQDGLRAGMSVIVNWNKIK